MWEIGNGHPKYDARDFKFLAQEITKTLLYFRMVMPSCIFFISLSLKKKDSSFE